MKRMIFSAFAASLLISTAVAAQAPEARSEQGGGTVETGDGERVICRSEKLTGSRLKVKRRCLTAQEWAEKKQFDRLDLERIQTQRYPHNSGASGAVIPTG